MITFLISVASYLTQLKRRKIDLQFQHMSPHDGKAWQSKSTRITMTKT